MAIVRFKSEEDAKSTNHINKSLQQKKTAGSEFFWWASLDVALHILKFLAIKDLVEYAKISKGDKAIAYHNALWVLKLNELTTYKKFPEGRSFKSICDDIHQYSKLEGYQCWNKTLDTKDTGMFFLQTPKIASKMRVCELLNKHMCPSPQDKHEVARYLIANSVDRIKDYDLQFFFDDPAIALLVLKHPILSKKIRGCDLCCWVEGRLRDTEAAKYVLDNIPLFRPQFDQWGHEEARLQKEKQRVASRASKARLSAINARGFTEFVPAADRVKEEKPRLHI